MFAEVIILTIMGIALLVWVIFCGIQGIRHGRDLAAEAGFAGHVKCEKCGTEYEVSAAEFTKSYMPKYKSVTRSKIQGGAFILAAASVPLYFAGRAGDQRTEELREQQYEDYKERYGL